MGRDQENPHGSGHYLRNVSINAPPPLKFSGGAGAEGREIESLPRDDCPEFRDTAPPLKFSGGAGVEGRGIECLQRDDCPESPMSLH